MNNKIKKMLSLITALTLQASLLVSSVNAATITSNSWSKNFESVKNVGPYSKWLDPWETDLDCTFEGASTFTLTVVDDEDTSHGKVLKVKKTDNTERFLMYQIPDISSGKFVFEFDLKLTGNGFVLSANETGMGGYYPVFRVGGNEFKSGAAEKLISTYEMNQWNKVRLIFDKSGKTVTVNVGGNSVTESFSNAKTQAMKFIQWGGAEYYLDNMKLYLLDSSASPAVQLYNGAKTVGNYLNQEVTGLTLELKDSAFASLPDITMTDLGTDIINESDDVDFEVSGVFSDGKILLTLEDYLEAGHRYKISVPEGVRDVFGRNISNNEIVFDATDSADEYVLYKSRNIDFTSYGTQNVAWNLDGDAAPVDREGCVGGKALKTSASNIFAIGPVKGSLKKGRLTMDMKVDSSAGSYSVQYDNSDAARANMILRSGGNLWFFYQAPAEHPNTIWDYQVTTDGVDTISYTLDADRKKSDIVLNGNKFTTNLPKTSGVPTIDQLRFFWVTCNEGTVYWDYFNSKYEYIPALVKGVTFVDAEGAEKAYSAENPVGKTDSVKIAFSEAMKEDTLSNITVSDGTANAAYTGTWNSADNTYTLAFTEALKSGATYTVTVPDTVKDAAGLPVDTAAGTFTTNGGRVAVTGVAITDANGEEITKLAAYEGNTIKVVLTGSNTTDEAATVYLAYAGYNGTALSEMNFAPVTFAAGSQSAEYTFTISDKSVLTKMKAFALKDMENIIPYCEAAIAD